ncbi:hypothetical protein OIU83_15370 [Flavobacterium sp. LS1R49]|uniref:Uncharacterized protein n=1 Tax=Flavobacterium shii TaxID=2987687 RepID=A0A9X2YW92_9FLAO|nr:hypothetical protein [Flavobacterium shii]MCV9929044.1 hypothetical protein [Flavobacterium shii]
MAVKKKPTVKGLKKVCSSVIKGTGLKSDGTLKKGFKYIKGGKIVKAKATTTKAKPAKKKTVKKPTVRKASKSKK